MRTPDSAPASAVPRVVLPTPMGPLRKIAVEVPGTWRGSVGQGFSFSSEELLDVRVLKLHPSETAVIALAGMGGNLHFAEERIHLGDE